MFDEEYIDPHGECSHEIALLREALLIARRWMPNFPLTQSGLNDVAKVNKALRWEPASHDALKKTD